MPEGTDVSETDAGLGTPPVARRVRKSAITVDRPLVEDLPVAPPSRRGRPGALAPALLVLTVVLALAAGGAAAAWNDAKPAGYRSSAVLLIDQEPALSQARDAGILGKLAAMRVKYADLVTTGVFAQGLAEDLSLPVGQVRGTVSATVPQSSLLLGVAAGSGDRSRAERLAQGAADRLRRELAAEQTAAGIKPAEQVTFTVVTPAERAEQVLPSRSRTAKLGLAAGAAVLLAGLALTAFVWRRR